MAAIALILLVVHIIAFIAGGANSVVMPILGARMANAGPAGRAELMGVAKTLARVGKWAMVTLIVTGLLVLWLKWSFVIPNVWFWVKMAGIVAMLVFIALGLGMALPFLILSFSPTLMRFMPKPGAWMETFKEFMAFPMYATALWLLWVL